MTPQISYYPQDVLAVIKAA